MTMTKCYIGLAYIALLLNFACESTSARGDDLTTILALLEDESRDRRLEAIGLLEKLGPQRNDALPALVGVLKDEDEEVRSRAAVLLGSIGAPARAALIRASESSCERTRVGALMAFEKMKSPGRSVTQAVVKALGDKSPAVRTKAADTLGTFRDPSTIKSLINLLSRENQAEVREYVICALENFEPVPRAAIPSLIEILLKNEEDAQRAAWALSRAGKPAIGPLIAVLRDAMRERLHSVVIRSLADIGPDAAAAVPLLKEKLNSHDKDIKRETIWALGAMGTKAGEAMSELKRILPNSLPSHRVFIAESISKIAPDDPLPCQVLAAELRNPDWDIRNKSAWALERMGPRAAKAVPALVTALSDLIDDVRKPASIALGAIGPKAKDALGRLQAIAEDVNETPSIRKAAREAVKKIGGE
jgi:HEAT repeat protein